MTLTLSYWTLQGVTFFITPGPWLLKRDVERIIESAGGTVDRSQKSLRHMRDYSSRFPKRSAIITSHEDYALMQDFFLAARRPHVISKSPPSQLIFTCEKYLVTFCSPYSRHLYGRIYLVLHCHSNCAVASTKPVVTQLPHQPFINFNKRIC